MNNQKKPLKDNQCPMDQAMCGLIDCNCIFSSESQSLNTITKNRINAQAYYFSKKNNMKQDGVVNILEIDAYKAGATNYAILLETAESIISALEKKNQLYKEALAESLTAMNWMLDNMAVVDKSLQSDAFNIPANAITQAEQALNNKDK